MNVFSPNQRRLSRKTSATADWLCSIRPNLEQLENRCLLSGGFLQVNLASNVPGWARVTDPNLVNPQGVAFSPTGPFWFADNGSGVSDLLDGRGQPVPLVVTVPSATDASSAPAGVVFNGGVGFTVSENGVSAPARFLFASEDGTISGWTSIVDQPHALLVVNNSSSGAVYTGLTLVTDPAGHGFLYATDFSHGTIDVFNQDFKPVTHPGAFQDPNLPNGFAPSNIQNIDNLLFVTYARPDEDKHDQVAGPGSGFIDVYNMDGKLIRRFASGGALNSPWGLALAPAHFGSFGGALLVGNNGDGHINAYDPLSGNFLGELADDKGIPIAIPNLWALMFGNGHAGGDSDTLFFAAGVTYEGHGLFGAIQSPEKRGADTAGLGVFNPNAPGETGDYPLPPSVGPAFRVVSVDRPGLTSDLLPLRELSLALVPTLSTGSQPGTGTKINVSVATIGGGSSSRSVFAAIPGAGSILLTSGMKNSRFDRSVSSNSVALNMFLDLNAKYAVGPHSSPSVNGDVRAEKLFAEAYIEQLEAKLSAEHGSATAEPPSQANEVPATSESCSKSADEHAVNEESTKAWSGDRWKSLTNFLVALSIPVSCTFWLWHERRLR